LYFVTVDVTLKPKSPLSSPIAGFCGVGGSRTRVQNKETVRLLHA